MKKILLFAIGFFLYLGLSAQSYPLKTWYNSFNIKEYLMVGDSVISATIIIPESMSLPVNPRVGRLVVYNDTLRQWSGLSWLKMGGGSGADPHITDSTLIITDPDGNYINFDISPHGSAYFENYWKKWNSQSDFDVFWDTNYFYWKTTDFAGIQKFVVDFNSWFPNTFGVSFYGDTILLGDTIGLQISNEDSALWNKNNVITLGWYEDRMGGSSAGIVSTTYADLQAAITAKTLIPGTIYQITDRGDVSLFFQAISTNQLATDGVRVMLCPSTYKTILDVYGNNWLGIWNAALTPVANDLVIWGGQVWKNVAGAVGVATDDVTLNAAWTLVTKAGFANWLSIRFCK
jgi:hypothetical protein